MSAKPTYFSCTLGQALALNIQQPHKTINELIDSLAKACPNKPAVGFAVPHRDENWSTQVYTFAEIDQGSQALAVKLVQEHSSELSQRGTIGLLCPSTPQFLFVWLALIRLGNAVLLIAPQCAPSAISSLCEQCKATLLLFDDSYADLAQRACQQTGTTTQNLICAELPFGNENALQELVTSTQEITDLPTISIQPDEIAYLHHTSGTSTGIPKPIPQTHNAAVGVLPRFEDGVAAATFTTTPLYHGGVADLFRAWSSRALIWLFPGKDAPITASNVIKCLHAADDAATRNVALPKVKYFSSVPYVLQLVSDESRGLEYLQGMDMVGVGGAALPAEVGDRLVSQNVNLLSRFGSAECGFLLSSHRLYTKDQAWQFLRPGPDQRFIKFELCDAGLAELVVLDGWPHMAKRNRDDGSFATADLFEPHPEISDAWRYHSRADSQLTLITGKKFDPAPLEADLATLPQISDAIIFGSGKPYSGVLLFRSSEAKTTNDEALVSAVWSKVARLNEGSQDHAKLSRSMLVPMALLDVPLEKSSKGTLLRSAAEQRFAGVIEQSYMQESQADDEVADQDLPQAIDDIIKKVSHRELHLTQDTDLFSAGIDSVAGMQIRSRLRGLLPKADRNIPMTIVEDCGNVKQLAEYVRLRRAGGELGEQPADSHDQMRALVEEYSKFDSSGGHDRSLESDSSTIVLTGATGALGTHILNQYRQMPSVKRIYCLVRGSSAVVARERVHKALRQRRLLDLAEQDDDKVIVLRADLGDEQLGLSKEMYAVVASEATAILHVAWSVNFRMRLSSFVKDNIASLRHLLNLALASPRETKPAFSFCSSVASVMAHPAAVVPEEPTDNAATATSIGYSQSKWVAEHICVRANTETALKGRIGIFRVGQLAGDTVHGVWNASEAWPIMLKSATSTRCLPALEEEIIDWLPVDIAATCLIQGTSWIEDHASSGPHIFHVLNSHTRPTWMEMLAWVQSSAQVDVVDRTTWVKRIEALETTEPDHPAIKLLSHWQNAYGNHSSAATSRNGDGSPRKQFATSATMAKLPVLETIQPVDQAYFGKLWRWIQKDM